MVVARLFLAVCLVSPVLAAGPVPLAGEAKVVAAPGTVSVAPALQDGRQAPDKLLPPGVLIPRDRDVVPMSPHVAVGNSGEVAVTYAIGNQIWVSVSPDGGKRFRRPVLVGGRGLLGRGPSRGPKIAVSDEAMVIVALSGDKLMGQDGDLFSWRSTDHGASWKGPVQINDVDDAPKEGLAAVAARGDGLLLSVWLDLRRGKTELWGAWSIDGGASWGKNLALYRSPDGTICQCCHPTVGFAPESGDALVMWRNSLDGNRDMYLARITGGVVGPARLLGSGHWPLEGCPQAGGGLAVSADDEVVTVWRRKGSLISVAPGGFEKQLGEGQQVRVGIGPKGQSTVWLERGKLRVTLGEKQHLLGPAENPWVASAPDGAGPVVVVWETGAKGPGRVHSRVLQTR